MPTSLQDGKALAGAKGVVAALGAGVLWGTMYIPYRKAYISGMNPLTFVTIFTFGELGTVLFLATLFNGGASHFYSELRQTTPVLFWLFLGGFCWVLGDLFQQYAAKYIGLGRGIPWSNTNQVWGLAWGVLVFGEMSGKPSSVQAMVLAGSLLTVAGAAAIGTAEATESEQAAWRLATQRECARYGLKEQRILTSLHGEDSLDSERPARNWVEWLGDRISQWLNVGNGRLYGIEVSYQQRLAMLPGALGGLGMFGNYSWTGSRVNSIPGRSDSPTMQRQAPNTWNLSYDRGRFSIRVGLSYNGTSIYQYQYQTASDVSGLGPHGPTGDVYTLAHTQIDAMCSAIHRQMSQLSP